MPNYESLPFVSKCPSTGELLMWEPDRSGDWAEQCQRGRYYAVLLVLEIRTTGNIPLLSRIIKAMRDTIDDGVETGFLTAIACELLDLSIVQHFGRDDEPADLAID